MKILDRIALHPILFAAYAILFVYAANLDEVLPVDAQAPLGRAILGALIALVVCSLLLRDRRRGAIVASALVIAFYAFGHVSGGLSSIGADQRMQLAGWAVLVIVALVYAIRARASLPSVTRGLNVLSLVLVLIAAWSIVPYEANRFSRGPILARSAIAADATSAASGPKRDIYFLVFDRYGSAEALERRFGITDNDLYDWLRQRGFQVPAHPHANYRATDFSLASTLNMEFLDGLTEAIGPVSGDRTPAAAMFKEHAVGRFLKAQGYTYEQLGSWFQQTRAIPIANENRVLGSTSEFESVVDRTTIVPAIRQQLGQRDPKLTFRDYHREATLFEFRELRRISTAPGPKFVFAHILLPHDPYVFHADGSPLSEAEADATPEAELYANHLAVANRQIKEIVGYLQAGPEATRPIIIIEGDEGPLECQSVDCVSNTPDYLRIRLGNLIAMDLPGVTEQLPDDYTSVNTFRTVFRHYFGADLPDLPNRSFTWPDNDHIYAFEDVTDKITGPRP